eukprot:TRINITY_DN1646_c0_g1_i2.p1 TRINITY_DN1646_c0_g1~~TRINITY_DN1646_c0_g1_i2.p1  ORF type:complete len:200 (-),score=72.04 TRINITY_DN1646_c0_g1_i2:118-717(-)
MSSRATAATKANCVRELFGGAITCAMPERLEDISRFREVQDNQEVFCDASTDESCIVELLALDEAVADADAARHYFDDIALCNDATHAESVANVRHRTAAEVAPKIDPKEVRYVGTLEGVQRVTKFKEHAANKVAVKVCVLRLPRVQTDLVVSLNTPLEIAADSSSSSHGTRLTPPAEAAAFFDSLLASLNILDYSLFC